MKKKKKKKQKQKSTAVKDRYHVLVNKVFAFERGFLGSYCPYHMFNPLTVLLKTFLKKKILMGLKSNQIR